MSQDINRLLMELERDMRSVNREVINPRISELTMGDLRPVLHLVADARARYLKALIDLCRQDGSLLERRGFAAPGHEPIKF